MKCSRLVSPVVLFALAACGGARSTTNGPASPPPALAPTAADADAAAAALADHVDPARGLALVAYLDDPSDGESPPMATTGLRCDPAEIDAVAAQLARYVAQLREDDLPVEWNCHDTRCELVGSMEYDPTRVLRFARTDDGRTIVVGLDLIDELLVDEERVREIRLEVEQQHAAMPAGCSATR